MSQTRGDAAREVPEVLLLSGIDLARWSADNSVSDQPGGELPYGMQALATDFRLVWTDAARRGGHVARAGRAGGGVVARIWPGMAGLPDALAAMTLRSKAAGALSVFEDAGLAFARLSRVGWPRGHALPHVMVCCWLSQDCTTMGRGELRSVRRSLSGVSRVVVFSSNQVPILASHFGIPSDRIDVVPFGVDTSYYEPFRVGARAGGEGVVAVGSDSRRDYATLFEAARLSGIRMTVACQPRNVAGLSVPENVQIVSAYGEAYRRLLHSADLVVTSTVAPAYPSGQSVVLEAMSMGRATLTTDSPAMREYVTDGVDGALMPVGDPVGVADRLAGLMADPARREALGRGGAKSVRARFDGRMMWTAIGAILRSAVG